MLTLAFKIADDSGLLLLDLKDLRALLQHVGDNAQEFQTDYGNVSAASIGAIQRGLLALEQQGADRFLGEPMLNVDDLLQTVDGKGVVNILAADQLMQSPKVYSTLLLWLLSELYERLPEVGDPRQAQARVLLRRGASAVHRRAASRCSRRSSRWCASSAPRASACSSSRRIRSTCRTRCWDSSATACSTRCARSRRATRRP